VSTVKHYPKGHIVLDVIPASGALIETTVILQRYLDVALRRDNPHHELNRYISQIRKGSWTPKSVKRAKLTILHFSPPFNLAIHLDVRSQRSLLCGDMSFDERKRNEERLGDIRRAF
jgi:hypothetical protein